MILRGGDPVLFLIPQDRPLVVAARTDPPHIDQILVGQQVNPRFTAPELAGQVVLPFADTFEDEALGALVQLRDDAQSR